MKTQYEIGFRTREFPSSYTTAYTEVCAVDVLATAIEIVRALESPAMEWRIVEHRNPPQK